MTARRFFYFKSQNVKGIAQIPIIVGLLIMAIAIPVVTRLSQQEQDTRQFAACPSAGSSCSGTQVTCCSTTKQQLVCTGGSWTVVANCPLGCEGDNCKPGCDYSFTNCKACGEGCAANEKSCYVTNNDCTKVWKCLNLGNCVANPTTPPSQNCGDHPNNSSWCDGNRRAYCSGGNTYFESCSYGCQANSSTWAVCAPAPTTKPSDPTPTPFCSPNSLKCQSNQQFKCNPLGTAWDFVHNCLGGCEGTLCKAYITNTPIPTNTSTPSPTNTPTSIPTRIPTAPICPSVGSSCSSTQVDCCQGYLYICTGGQWRSERCSTGCKDSQTCNTSCDYSILLNTCTACGASGQCSSGQKKCTIQKTDCGRQEMCLNFPSQCASDTTPTPLPTSLPDGVCSGNRPNHSTWCQSTFKKGYCLNGVSYFEDCTYGCSDDACKPMPTLVPSVSPACIPYSLKCVNNSTENAQYKCNGGGTGWEFVMNCNRSGCNGNLCNNYVTNTPPPSCDGFCKPYSPQTGFSSCTNYSMESSTGNCETGLCCKYSQSAPVFTCNPPNVCRDTGGGRANCSSYNQTSVTGTCPQGQVCCANKPSPSPMPTPTLSNLKCSFDGQEYPVKTEICGKGGLFSRCKDGQKCICGSDGKWEIVNCLSGACLDGNCTQACLFQGQYYGPDKTVCDTSNNLAGTCSKNGQWIWINCGSSRYCQQGLCLPKVCCCVRSASSLSSVTERCQLLPEATCSSLNSTTSPAYKADMAKCQTSSSTTVTTTQPNLVGSPTPNPVINPSGVTEGGYCTGSLPVWCGGTPAKQYICTGNTWRSVSTCQNGCSGNRCLEVVNNCDYVILERKGQCGSYCPNLNEIQFKVQTGKRLTDGSCETAYRCYPRPECTVNTGCTNGQLNGAKWCSGDRPCTCNSGKIECGQYCVYGCLDGQCGSPQSVDQVKFTSNLSSEDFFTLDDQSLINKHCRNLGGTPDQIKTCLSNTDIEKLIRGLDPQLEAVIIDLRQATLRKLDYLYMDKQSLASKYCGGVQACIANFNPQSLLSGLSQQEINLINQQKAEIEAQSRIQDYFVLSPQDMAKKYCQSDPVCIANFTPESLLSGLSQADKDRLIKQKQAAAILSDYQNTSLVSAEKNISAEEERYLVGKCLELGGNCSDKQSALAYFLQLSSPNQPTANYDYYLYQLENDKKLRQEELDAYNRVSKTLINLGIINPYTGLLDPKYQGQSFVELEQKLTQLRSTDPAINAVIIYNNLTGGAAKRGIDIAHASDATTLDFIRGNLTYAAPAAGMAAGIGALALAAPFGGAAALSYLGTGMGISGTVNSLSSTAENCGGDNMDAGKCALSVARTAFMATSTGIGVISGAAPMAKALNDIEKVPWYLKSTQIFGNIANKAPNFIKVANIVTSGVGTGVFGIQTVQSYQQEGLSLNTIFNAAITITTAGRFVQSIAGEGGLLTVAKATTTAVDLASDTGQAVASCYSFITDPSGLENCVRDLVALSADIEQIGDSINAKRVLQQATDQAVRGNLADSDPINRYFVELTHRTAVDTEAEINKINNLRQAELASNPSNADAINARFDQQIEDYKAIRNRQSYDERRLLGRIIQDGLSIVFTDDQGIPRPIVDIQKEVETILSQRNPIIKDYQEQLQRNIDQMDQDSLFKLISDNDLPARIIDTDGNRLDLDGLRKSVADAYSAKLMADARLFADTVIRANDAGQPITYRNPDGSLKALSDIIPPKTADTAQAEPVKQPDQPIEAIQPKSPNIFDKIAGLFKPASTVLPDIKPAEVGLTIQDIKRIADNVDQGHVNIKPSTDSQGNQYYRFETQASASQQTIESVSNLNQVISDFEDSFGHHIRQSQLELIAKPESIRQLQAGGGKTAVMAHLEAVIRRNAIIALPNQTDAESFVREIQSRSDFYAKQGLQVIFYDNKRGFLSIDGDFNIAKAKRLDYSQVEKIADQAQADPSHRGLIIITTSADNAWGVIGGRKSLSPESKLIYDAVLGTRDFHLVVDEIGSVVQGEYSVSSGKPIKLIQLTDPLQMYGFRKSADMISASKAVDDIAQVKLLLSQVESQLSQGRSNQDLFFEYDGITRPYPKDPQMVNSSYASLIDVVLARSNGNISPQFESELRAIAQKLTDSSIDGDATRKLYTDMLQKTISGNDASVLTELSYMTSYLQSKWHIMSMVPGNDFGLESGDLVIRKLGGTSGEKFSQITDLIAMQTDGITMLRSAGIDIGNGKIAPIGDLTYTPDSFKISNLEILRAKAASGKLAGYDATPDTAARAIGVLATAGSERPRNPTDFAVNQDMVKLIQTGINDDYIARHSNQALGIVIADDGVPYKTTTDAFLSRQMELRGQTEITLARTKYKTELAGDQKTEYFFEKVTRNPDGSISRTIIETFTDQDSWGQKIHQSLSQDPLQITIVFEGRTRAVDLKVEETSKLVTWGAIASDQNTMEDITQSWKRNRVAAGTGAAELWDDQTRNKYSEYLLLVRSRNDQLTGENVIDFYQARLNEKLSRDNFDTTLRQIAETPKSGIDTVKSLLSSRPDFQKIADELDNIESNVDRVIRASVTEILYKPLDSDQIPGVIYDRGRAVYDQLKNGIDTIVDQYKLSSQEEYVIRRQLGLDEPYISRASFDNILAQPSRNPDLSLIGPSGLVRNWAMANSSSDLPKYAWTKSADADTVAIQTEIVRQSIAQSRQADVQTRVNQIADSLGRIEIPRGYDITSGMTANFLQTALGTWTGKPIANSLDKIRSDVNAGKIDSQTALDQALRQSLSPLIEDTVLRQTVIDSIMSGPVAKSLKADDIADSSISDQSGQPVQSQHGQDQAQSPAKPADQQSQSIPSQDVHVSQDTIDKANILRTTSKGSQESVEDYTNRINSLWQERQQLIDTAQALHLDLSASIGDQPWSTFKTRATSYISQAQKLNDQANNISLDLTNQSLTISELNQRIKAKQAEIEAQRQATAEADRLAQEALNVIKQKAKNLGATDKELSEALTQAGVQKLINQITKEVLDAQQEAYDKNINISAASRLVGRSRVAKINEIIAQAQAKQQAEQVAKALADAKQQAKSDYGITASGLTVEQVQQQVDQIKKEIDQLQTDSGLTFRSIDPSETFAAFKTRARSEITRLDQTRRQSQAQAERKAKVETNFQNIINQIRSLTPDQLNEFNFSPNQSLDDFIKFNTEAITLLLDSFGLNDYFRQSSNLNQAEWQDYLSQARKALFDYVKQVVNQIVDSSTDTKTVTVYDYDSRLATSVPKTIEFKKYNLKSSRSNQITLWLPSDFQGSQLYGYDIDKLFDEFQTMADLLQTVIFNSSDLVKPYNVFISPITREYAMLGQGIFLPQTFTDRGVIDAFSHELVHVLAYQNYGTSSVNHLTEGLAVRSIQKYKPNTRSNSYVSFAKTYLTDTLLKKLVDQRPSLTSPLALVQFLYPQLDRNIEDVVQHHSYLYGIAFSESFQAYLSDEYGLTPQESYNKYLELYQKSCGVVRKTDSSGASRIISQHGQKQNPNIDDGQIIQAIMESMGYANDDYDKVVSNIIPIIADIRGDQFFLKSQARSLGFSSSELENQSSDQIQFLIDQTNIHLVELEAHAQDLGINFINVKNLPAKQKIAALQDLVAQTQSQPPSPPSNPFVLLNSAINSITAAISSAVQTASNGLRVVLTARLESWNQIISILDQTNRQVVAMLADDLQSYQWSPDISIVDFISQNRNLLIQILESNGLNPQLRQQADIVDYEFNYYISDFGSQIYSKLKSQNQSQSQVPEKITSPQTQPLSNTPSSLQDYQTTNLESQAKAIQTLINNVNIQLKDIDTNSNNPDTLQKSLESLTKIQQQLQSNPSYQTNPDLQQLNTDIQSQIDQVQTKISSLQTEVDQPQKTSLRYSLRDGLIQPDLIYTDDQYAKGLQYFLDRPNQYQEKHDLPHIDYLQRVIKESGISIKGQSTTDGQTYYQLVKPSTKRGSLSSKFYVYPKSEESLVNMFTAMKEIIDQMAHDDFSLEFKYYENYLVFYVIVDPLVTQQSTYLSITNKLSDFFANFSGVYFEGSAEDPTGSFFSTINDQIHSGIVSLSAEGPSNDSLLDRIFSPHLLNVLRDQGIKLTLSPIENYNLLRQHFQAQTPVRQKLLQEFRKLCDTYLRNPESPNTRRNIPIFIDVTNPDTFPIIKTLIDNGYNPIIINSTNINLPSQSTDEIKLSISENKLLSQGFLPFTDNVSIKTFIDSINQPAQTQLDSDSLKSQISQLETQLGIRSFAKFDSQTGTPISTDNLAQRLQDLSIVSRVRDIYSQIQTSLQTYLVNYLSQQINTLLSSRSFSSPEQLHLFISQAFDQTFTLIKKGKHPNPYDDNQAWLWNTIALQIVALDTDKQLSESQVRSITNQLAMSFSSSQQTYYQSIIDNLSYQTSQTSNIYATSDIHGDWDQFLKLAQTRGLIDRRGNWIAPAGTKLFVLGDMLDRAPKGKHSYQVVENMMNLQRQAGKDSQGNDNVVVLMGNHELIMLKVLDIFGNMLNNGFKKQEAANIASSPNVSGFGFNIDPQDILYLYDHPDLASWIKSLPFIIQVDNSLYLHSNSYDYRNFGSSIDEINANLRLVVENGSHQIKNPLTDSTKPITISDLAGLITQGEGYMEGSILGSGLVDSILKTFNVSLDKGKIIHGHDQKEGMTGQTLDPRVTNVDSGMSEVYNRGNPDRGTFKIVDQNTTITNASINVGQVVSFDPYGCSSCALVRQKVEDLIEQAKKKGKDAIEWTWAFGAANDHDFRNDPEQFELNFLIWLHSFFVRQDKSSLRMANLWGQRTTDVILKLITQGGLDPLSLIDLNLRLARVEQQLAELKDIEASPSSPLVVVKDNLIELRNLFNRTFGQSTSDTASDLSLDLPFTNNSQTTIDEFSSLVGKDFWQAFDNLPDDTHLFHIQDIGSTAQVWSLDLNILLKDYQSVDDLVLETFNLADLKSFIQENNLDLKTIIAPDLSNPLSFLLLQRQILPPQLIKTYLMTDDGAWIEANIHALDNTKTLSPLPGDIYYFKTNIEHIDNYFYILYNHYSNNFFFINYGPSWLGIKTGFSLLNNNDSITIFGKIINYKILPDGSIQINITNSSPLTFNKYFLPCQGEDRGGG